MRQIATTLRYEPVTEQSSRTLPHRVEHGEAALRGEGSYRTSTASMDLAASCRSVEIFESDLC